MFCMMSFLSRRCRNARRRASGTNTNLKQQLRPTFTATDLNGFCAVELQLRDKKRGTRRLEDGAGCIMLLHTLTGFFQHGRQQNAETWLLCELMQQREAHSSARRVVLLLGCSSRPSVFSTPCDATVINGVRGSQW